MCDDDLVHWDLSTLRHSLFSAIPFLTSIPSTPDNPIWGTGSSTERRVSEITLKSTIKISYLDSDLHSNLSFLTCFQLWRTDTECSTTLLPAISSCPVAAKHSLLSGLLCEDEGQSMGCVVIKLYPCNLTLPLFNTQDTFTNSSGSSIIINQKVIGIWMGGCEN